MFLLLVLVLLLRVLLERAGRPSGNCSQRGVDSVAEVLLGLELPFLGFQPGLYCFVTSASVALSGQF